MTSGAGSRHRQATARLAALSLVALLLTSWLLASCSAGEPTSTASGAADQGATGAAASSTRPAELLAGLTQVLVERVYVTQAAAAAVAVRATRPDAPSPESSRVALDASSQAVASVLGAVYSDAQPPLLLALRDVDRLQLEHAQARAQGDVAAVTQARIALEQAQLGLSAVLRRVVPGLGAQQVRDRLMPDLEAQLAAGGDDPYTALRAAAARVRDTARVLSAGIAEDRGLGVSGTRAARLRADLTALLTEHVLLTGGLAGELATAEGGDAVAARAALDANALELAAVLGRGYPGMGEPFLQAWAAHVARLEDYARAVATGGMPQGDALRGFSGALADLLAMQVDGLPTDRISSELAPALEAMLRAVDAAAKGSPDLPAELRRAAATAPAPAALLAAAIAEDLQLR